MSASPRELAEALWLAELMAAAEGPADAQGLGSSAIGREAPTSTPADRLPRPHGDTHEAAASTPGRNAFVPERRRGVHVEGSGYASLLPLTLPTPREIQEPLAYIRALRPLRHTTPSRSRRVLDETATVRQSAEIARPFPVWRPAPERFFDVQILVDQGPSMVLWKFLAPELRGVLERLAAFRTIRITPFEPHGPSKPLASRDRSERLVVLLVSDCVGPAWSDGSAHRMLALWGRRSLVAVLNPLPRRLWDRTAVATRELVVRAHRHAQPNRTLRVLGADPPWRSDATDGIPVPLIGLRADEVAAWANLISGRAGHGTWLTVLSDTETSGGSASTVSEVRARPSPLAAVREFSRTASPAAFKLAGMLATTPLALPVMRAVQYLTEQEFGSAHLAEVFLSGLIERSDTEHDFFDFAPGVRKTLLGTIRRSDAAWLISRLDEWISRNMTLQPASFAAFIESGHGDAGAVSETGLVPFATIPSEVLRTIGGGYAPTERLARERWEGKLLVLGEGAAGKTSLIRNLLGEPFDLAEPTTHGLRITDLVLPHPTQSDTSMTLRVWDFGGQQIYHSTHQYFLSKESVCLLVWNSRAGWEQGRLRYWLELISARIPTCPIIVVATHARNGSRPVDLPMAELRREYPQIEDLVIIDNEVGQGVDALREAIAEAAAMLPTMGTRWPTSWLDAMRAVEDLGSYQTHVTATRLWRTMAETGLHDHGEQIQLARAMHATGVILYFADDVELAEIAILNPAWLAQRISLVLDDYQVADEQGLLRRSRLRDLWGDLDPGMREHLLALMDRFDVAYRVSPGARGDDVVSLVVERLPWDPPSDWEEHWNRAPSGDTAQQISLIYQVGIATPGIPSWFIARSLRFSTGIQWRNGALLAHPDGLHQGLIRSSRERDSIELTVRGPAPVSFFAVLSDMFNDTLERYPGLTVRRMVPCNCEDGCPELYNYTHLLRRMERAHLTIECPRSFRSLHVPQLLLGLPPRALDLDNISTSIDRIAARLDRTAENQQQMYLAVQQIKAVQDVHCPRVFTVTKVKSNFATSDTYQLRLFCEQPGYWHPLPDNGGTYRMRNSPDWLRLMTPFIRALASTIAGSTPSDNQLSRELEAMQTLVADIPASFPARAEDTDLRGLEQALVELDPSRAWGGLRRTLTPEGLTLYLCPEHAALYGRPGPDT